MANNTINSLSEINESKDFWNVKVRVIKKWALSWRLDLIFIDENGSKIQGYVKQKLMADFDSLLQEDSVVVIKKCGVGLQDDRYPILEVKKKINFYKCTEVNPVVGWTGHPYGFQFRDLEEINEQLMGQVLTIDVIGTISWCGNMDIFKNHLGKETKRVHLDLQNLEGTLVRCTFWAEFAVQVSTYVAAHGRSMEHIVLIIQHGKIKKWAETITVQNDMFGTRLFLDDDIEEINNFRRRLITKQGGHGNSQSIVSSQTNYPVRNEFIVNGNRKSVEEIREIELVRTSSDDPNLPLKVECVVLCTIKLLEEEVGWYYPACLKCKKKIQSKADYLRDAPKPSPAVQGAPADSLWCPKCNCQAHSVVPKFRIQFRVQDATGSISFLMFDSEVSRLTGLSATDIRERQLQSHDENTFPHELDALKDRLLAFKIVVTDYNVKFKYHVYTANKVCDDPDIINEMLGQDAVTQCTPEPASAEIGCVKLSESSQTAVDSKDAASVTGECLTQETEKDCATSPVLKRPLQKVSGKLFADAEASATKKLRKKLEPYDE